MSDAAMSLCDAFDAAVAAHRDRVALRGDTGDVSYAHLQTRAHQIAAVIHARGTPPIGHAALLFDQGTEAIAAILGTLYAGWAFVALDPMDPPARLEGILRESEAPLLLTDAAHAALAARICSPGCHAVRLDDGATVPSLTVPAAPRSDSLAWICYTSGSTGRPKGVLQTHGHALHFVRSYCEPLGIDPQDRVSLLYTLSFSAANMDIFGALIHGAMLCLYDVRRRGATGLADWITATGITVLHAVPTVFRHVLQDRADAFRLPTVRAIDLGGEPVFRHDLRLLQRHFCDGCLLVNHLAATEASVIARQVFTTADAGAGDGCLSVGRPAPGVEVRVLRADGRPAEADEPGDLVITSPYLSPGYWRRPDLTGGLTADPAREGWRVYHSGDMGRMDARGCLTVEGRRDARVKVRGHGVSLVEVESALRGLQGVRDAAVLALPRGAEADGVKLVGFIAGEATDAARLRRTLAEVLPVYMIPEDIRILPVLPRTSTAKIDRQALLDIAAAAAPVGPTSEGPRNSNEAQVSEWFTRLLGCHAAGWQDNFFELGGNSLQLAQLQAGLQEQYGVILSAEALLANATVAGVASLLRTGVTRPALVGSGCLVALRTGGFRRPIFLVHGALCQPLLSPAFLDALGEDQPVYGFRAPGLNPGTRPRTRLRALATGYIRAMRAVQPEGPYLIGGLCVGSFVTVEMAVQLRLAGQAVLPLVLVDPPMIRRAWHRRLWMFIKLSLGRIPGLDGINRRMVTQIEEQLLRRGSEGKITDVSEDAALRGSAVRVVLAFRAAVYGHRLRRYEGDAVILVSVLRRQRLEAAGAAQKFCGGNVTYIEVGDVHRNVLDPANRAFARGLRQAMARAQG